MNGSQENYKSHYVPIASQLIGIKKGKIKKRKNEKTILYASTKSNFSIEREKELKEYKIYKKKNKKIKDESNKSRLRKILDTNKCSICSWIGPCDIHRKKPGYLGGEYKLENVEVVCPNCHRLAHRNIIKGV